MREVVTPVPVVPSPKFHEYELIVPSLSLDPEASKEQTRLTQLKVKLATGLIFAAPLLGFTRMVLASVAPLLSVTVRTTSRWLPSGKSWLMILPVPVVPSSKSHE